MGMFDYVNFKTSCPTCGTEMHGFQTKDRGCDMVTVEPDSVNDFYSSCRKCDTWVEFFRPAGNTPTRAVPITEAEVLALGFEKEVRVKK
jgi:hypothetical protein